MRAGGLEVERTDAGVAIVTISGEHDLGTAPQLRGRLGELLDAGTPLVVDLTPASFIDSSILGAVLEAHRRAGEGGAGLAVAHAGEAGVVHRLLEVTGLRERLPVHATREAAIAAAADGGAVG